VDTNDNRPVRRVEVDALLRRLLAVDKDARQASIDDEILRRRLALI